MSNEASPSYRRKILTPSALVSVAETARAEGRTIVHCHGCFDILHPGHIRHLSWARQQGDVLVVSITADAFVNKGPGRPFIPEELRAENLAALEMVDYVTINRDYAAAELLEQLRPDLYVKGKEAETDESDGMRRERETVEGLGGRVLYSSGELILSSTRLGRLAGADLDLSRELVEVFGRRHGLSLDGLLQVSAGFRGRPVLLVGEALVVEEVTCKAVGLTSEAPSLELRELAREREPAGVAGMAEWVAGLGGRPRVVALAGSDAAAQWLEEELRSADVECALVRDDTRPTAVRQAYRRGGEPVMRVLRASVTGMPSGVSKLALAEVQRSVEGREGVLAMDLGCGLWTPDWREAFLPLARESGAVFVGTTSVAGEVAPIERIRGADVTVMSEREARVALQDADGSIEELGRRVMARLDCGQLVLRAEESSSPHEGSLLLFSRQDGGTDPLRDRGPLSGERSAFSLLVDVLPSLSASGAPSEQGKLAALAALLLSLAGGATVHEATFLSSVARVMGRARPRPGEDLNQALCEQLERLWTQHFTAESSIPDGGAA